MEIHVSYYIKVFADGAQFPLMHIHPLQYESLAHLAFGHLSKSVGVHSELNKIDNVLSGTLETFSFGGDDWCIVEVRKVWSRIVTPLTDAGPIEIGTIRLREILQGWYDFLLLYEGNHIPGLIRKPRH